MIQVCVQPRPRHFHTRALSVLLSHARKRAPRILLQPVNDFGVERPLKFDGITDAIRYAHETSVVQLTQRREKRQVQFTVGQHRIEDVRSR